MVSDCSLYHGIARGLGNERAQHAVTDLTHFNHVDILFLFETKVHSINSGLVASWGFQEGFMFLA